MLSRKNRGFGLLVILLTSVFIGVLYTASWCTKSEYVLKAATALPPEHPNSMGVAYFADLVKEKTNGRVVVETYFGGKLGSIPQLVDSVKTGVIDICVANPAVLSRYWQPIQMLDFRYLYVNVDNMLEVVKSPIGKEMADRFYKKTDMVILNYHGAAQRNIITKDRPIWTIEDLKGLKIRSVEGDYPIKWIKALGAMPEVVAFTEVYTALQAGVVDGAENEFIVFDRNKWAEAGKYIALTRHNYTVRFLLIGGPRFRRLPKDIQSIILECGEKAGDYAIELQREVDLKKKEEIKAKYNLRFTEPYRKPFIEVSESVTREFVKKIGVEDMYQEILEIRKKYE